jgi:hypothetical protein
MRVAERFFAGAAEHLRTAVSFLRTLELAQLRPIQSGGQSWLPPHVHASPELVRLLRRAGVPWVARTRSTVDVERPARGDHYCILCRLKNERRSRWLVALGTVRRTVGVHAWLDLCRLLAGRSAR